jgi:sugar phosphate isomerase/epimerase
MNDLHLKIGLVLESLALPLKPALFEAAKLSVQGVQLDAVGLLAPENLGDTARRDFRTQLRSLNLELTALHCPLRKGLDSYEFQEQRIDHVTKAMQLAYDLGAKKLILPMPKIPDDAAPVPEADEGPKPHLFFSGPPPKRATLRETLTELGHRSDRMGTWLGLDGGLDSGTALKAYLDSFGSGSLGANFDPANFLMNGFDPMASLMALGGAIKHVHARDAQRTSASAGPVEVAVGGGDLDWLTIVASLEAIEYRGFLSIERTAGEARLADVKASVTFLRRFVPLTKT